MSATKRLFGCKLCGAMDFDSIDGRCPECAGRYLKAYTPPEPTDEEIDVLGRAFRRALVRELQAETDDESREAFWGRVTRGIERELAGEVN